MLLEGGIVLRTLFFDHRFESAYSFYATWTSTDYHKGEELFALLVIFGVRGTF
jgi:hypothetical protein